jgi:hypothetical protein
MTLSTLTKTNLNCQPIAKSDYLELVDRSRHLDFIEHFLSRSQTEYPNLHQAVVGLIESGKTVWGVPEFEQNLFDVLKWWAADGLFVRVQLFARWLVQTTDDAETRRWLSDFARGEFWEYLNATAFQRRSLGSPEDYLYPLQFDRLVESQLRRDAMRSLRRMNGQRLASSRCNNR